MVMLALIRMSSRKGGSGAIIARTMPSTAIGTPNSIQLPDRAGGIEKVEPAAPLLLAPAPLLPAPTAAGSWVLTGSWGGAAIYFLPIYLFPHLLFSWMHEFEDVRQHFRHCPIQMRRNLLAHVG